MSVTHQEEVVEVSSYQQSVIEQELKEVEEIIGGRVVWTDVFKADWWRYLCDNHPTISMFRSHHLHPYTRRERQVVYACTLCMTFMLTAMIPDLSDCDDDARVRDAEMNAAGVIEIQTTEECVDEFAKSTVGIGQTLARSFIIMVFGFFLKTMATCKCVQGQNAMEFPLAKRILEAVGHGFMWASVLLSCVFLGVGFSRLIGSGLSPVNFVWSFAVAQVLASFYALLLNTAFFVWKRHKELAQRQAEHDYVHNTIHHVEAAADEHEHPAPQAAYHPRPTYGQPQQHHQQKHEQRPLVAPPPPL